MSARKCGVPHPRYRSHKCQREPGHEGSHNSRRGRVTHVWNDYLPVYQEIVAQLMGH